MIPSHQTPQTSALSTPLVARVQRHTREVLFHGYEREDGLWDIEASLLDVKPIALAIPGEIPRGPREPIHWMQVRLTVNTKLVIQAVEVVMRQHPHEMCPEATPPMQGLVGVTLGKGWRKAIQHHLGGTVGCAHLRELLFNMGTAAIQSMIGFMEEDDSSDAMPPHLDQCYTWDTQKTLVAKVYPMHYQKR